MHSMRISCNRSSMQRLLHKTNRILLNDLEVNSINCDYINKKLKNINSAETLNDTECILCRKDVVSICRYCFSIALVRILRELNFTEDLIGNFEYDTLYGEIPLKNEFISDNKMEVIKYE